MYVCTSYRQFFVASQLNPISGVDSHCSGWGSTATLWSVGRVAELGRASSVELTCSLAGALIKLRTTSEEHVTTLGYEQMLQHSNVRSFL